MSGAHAAKRRAGVLLHLASLGAGALGAPSRRFIDWLVSAGFSVWQMLPVGPTGSDGSPYWLSSDYAGHAQYLASDELTDLGSAAAQHAHAVFLAASKHWLPDFALFEAIRAARGGRAWLEWEPSLRDRSANALTIARRDFAAQIAAITVEQFQFDYQWQRLRAYAHQRGVQLLGDLPIYVAPDSVETWAHREQFLLDASGRPTAFGGVPPDYFSTDGQLWGNPLYNWEVMAADGFRHWRARIGQQLARFDLLRLDHFRGLESHWAVPTSAPTAADGQWRHTPGHALLEALRRDGAIEHFIAEDLGDITSEVDSLRKEFGLPGMHVLQFAFDGAASNPHLPHMHRHGSVVYTGTHDNDTLRGWLNCLDWETVQCLRNYFGTHGDDLHATLIRAALGSVSGIAVLPMQDLLNLDSEARLNTPGTVRGNWTWQLPQDALRDDLARHFAQLNRLFARS